MAESEFLTDEFIEFSQNIATIHKQKKQLQDAFKVEYDKFKSAQAVLDQEAEKLVAEWENWKQSKKNEDN